MPDIADISKRMKDVDPECGKNLRIFLKFGKVKQPIDIEDVDLMAFNGYDLKEFIKNTYKIDDFHLCTPRGVDLNLNNKIINGDVFCLYPKTLGGKGGFGSLLRAFGKQITKSTNRDACRDLSGRRIKTVKRDKMLQDFKANQAERAKQKEEEKKEKREKRKAELDKKHMFSDPKYDEQKNKISKDLDDALTIAMNDEKKRKIETTDSLIATTSAASVAIEKPKKEKPVSTIDKFKDWTGVPDISDDSEESESDETEESKKKKLKTLI